ncbi:1700_t:CDS:10 [Cetraspora pellucida]|uniref:1700_t:CDS:1 n=1 Tax=Cetraspora pellucida TaxID=1433469 RepID=A0A9N9CN36_9GLOM|nr:1700_t:CDS:10 [Cetraspora pellucida]
MRISQLLLNILFGYLLVCISSLFASDNSWFNLPSFLKFNEIGAGNIKLDEKFHELEDNDLSAWAENFLKLSNEEKMIVERGHASLIQFERKQNCFKDAALTLRHGCRNIDISDNDKIKYAVRLTMCEIATANLVAPMECNDIQDVGTCVEALARIPQLWTSYSGYFREVFHMCFAVRYSLERDLLEELHRNITQNQLINYSILRVQQSDMISWRKEEMARLIQLEKSQSMILNSVNVIEKITSLASVNMVSLKDNLSDSQEIVQGTLSQLSQLREELEVYRSKTSETFEEINSATDQQFMSLKQTMEYVESIAKINIKISENLQKIDTALHNILMAQEKVYNIIEAHKDQHQDLANQWQNSLLEAKQNLQMLLNISQSEIQLLAKTASDARESQESIIKILRPLGVFVEFINWIYEITFIKSSIKYIIPWLAIPFIRFLVSWMRFGRIMSIVVFNFLLILLFNMNNTQFLQNTNVHIGVFAMMNLAILIITFIRNRLNVVRSSMPQFSANLPIPDSRSPNPDARFLSLPRTSSSDFYLAESDYGGHSFNSLNGSFCSSGSSVIYELSQGSSGRFPSKRTRRSGRNYFP